MLRWDQDISFKTLDVTRTGVCLLDGHVKVDRSLLFVMNVRQSEVICLWSEVVLLQMFCIFC